MSYEIIGEHVCKLDDKGRFRIPSPLLDQVPEQNRIFYVNRGFERNLMMYPNDVWERKVAEIAKLNIYNNEHRRAVRYFYRGASKVLVDKVGRVLLPKTFIDYAQLKKEVILFAYQQNIEIWSKSNYDIEMSHEPDDFASIIGNIFGGASNEGKENYN